MALLFLFSHKNPIRRVDYHDQTNLLSREVTISEIPTMFIVLQTVDAGISFSGIYSLDLTGMWMNFPSIIPAVIWYKSHSVWVSNGWNPSKKQTPWTHQLRKQRLYIRTWILAWDSRLKFQDLLPPLWHGIQRSQMGLLFPRRPQPGVALRNPLEVCYTAGNMGRELGLKPPFSALSRVGSAQAVSGSPSTTLME